MDIESFHFEPEFALAAGGDNDDDDSKWWIDSACSRHMTGDKTDLVKSVNLKILSK